jgi:hypothetical protein
MPFTYQAILSVDYTEQDSNQYARLKHALVQAGWLWVETSAFAIETDNLALVWRGVDLVARQSALVGKISTFTFNIVGSDHFDGAQPAYPENHTRALENILGLPFPQP